MTARNTPPISRLPTPPAAQPGPRVRLIPRDFLEYRLLVFTPDLSLVNIRGCCFCKIQFVEEGGEGLFLSHHHVNPSSQLVACGLPPRSGRVMTTRKAFDHSGLGWPKAVLVMS